MRLIDAIAQGRSIRCVTPVGAELPGASAFQSRIRNCPLRYVLADDLVTCATHLAFAEGDRLSSCLDLIRVPAQMLWVEWVDAPRRNALAVIPALRVPQDGAARRAGAFISAASHGRSGCIRTFWSTIDDTVLLSPVVTLFDLDGIPGVSAPAFEAAFLGEATLRLDGEPAIEELLVHFRCHFDSDWARYYGEHCNSAEQRAAVLHASLGGCAFDGPMLMAFFLLLGAHDLLPSRMVTQDRLNVIRQRSGKTPLLDHIEVFAPLDAGLSPSNDLTESDSTRSSPRLHHVRGHLVRRGLSVFWRSPHMRGSARLGQVRTRTVELSFARH
jgi:hypothetical protein